MSIINEKVRHVSFGDGKVIRQENGRITIQFSEQYGEKQFLYPDAFDKYLRLLDSGMEQSVLLDLNKRQEQLEAERLKKQQEYEAELEKMTSEKARLAAEKRKPKKRQPKSAVLEQA